MRLYFRFIILLLFVIHTTHLFAQFTPRPQSGTSGSKRTYNRYDLDKYISGKEKTPEDSIKEIHELMMWFFVAFAGGHILGIVMAENKEDSGLVSDMINGGDPKI